jgi:glycosyltransferase involved in cell wall biosynthesis
MGTIKICGITTRPATSRFMVESFSYLKENGFEPCIICQYDKNLENLLGEKGIKYIPLPMKSGNVNPIEVVKRTYQLYGIFNKYKFDIIQYASCNASLYSCIAGWLSHVPERILCQWGLTYLGYEGVKRIVFRAIERLTCYFSTVIQPDSHTNLQFAIDEKLFRKGKGSVIWNGSACGLDFSRFDVSLKSKWKEEIRCEFAIRNDSKVFGFVGRIVRDKGVNELLGAFLKYQKDDQNSYLLMMGPKDGMDEIEPDLKSKVLANSHIIFAGPRNDINRCYAVLDYMVLPSYREGFGMVVLEAAAMKVPVISSNILGPTDFVKDCETGLVCDVKSTESLYHVMLKTRDLSSVKYRDLCENAYKQAKENFEQSIFNHKVLEDRLFLYERSKK